MAKGDLLKLLSGEIFEEEIENEEIELAASLEQGTEGFALFQV